LKDISELEGQYIKAPVKYGTSTEKAQTRTNCSKYDIYLTAIG
jgi:hypothetical protein